VDNKAMRGIDAPSWSSRSNGSGIVEVSVWLAALRGRITVAEPPRNRTGFLNARRQWASA